MALSLGLHTRVEMVEGSLRLPDFLREHPLLYRLIDKAWTATLEELLPEVVALARRYQAGAKGDILEGIDRSRLQGAPPARCRIMNARVAAMISREPSFASRTSKPWCPSGCS